MILELATDAGRLFDKLALTDQARLLKTLLLNCTFDRGKLCPTYFAVRSIREGY